MKKQTIKNRYTNEIIFECKAETFKECVEKAVEEGANLVEADFRKADLSEADLSEANLVEADFRKADLSEADLSEANLVEANFWRANLSGANLWGANLSGADLNSIFYKTKVTKKQIDQIINSDLFDVEK